MKVDSVFSCDHISYSRAAGLSLCGHLRLCFWSRHCATEDAVESATEIYDKAIRMLTAPLPVVVVEPAMIELKGSVVCGNFGGDRTGR